MFKSLKDNIIQTIAFTGFVIKNVQSVNHYRLLPISYTYQIYIYDIDIDNV